MQGENSHLMGPGSNQRQQAQIPCKGHDILCTMESQPAKAGLATCRAQKEWLLWGRRGDLQQMRAARRCSSPVTPYRQQCPETTPTGVQLHPKQGHKALFDSRKWQTTTSQQLTVQPSTARSQTTCLTSEAFPTSPSHPKNHL